MSKPPGAGAPPGLLRALLLACNGRPLGLSLSSVHDMPEPQAQVEFQRVLALALSGCTPSAKALMSTLQTQWLAPQPLLMALWQRTGWDELAQAATRNWQLVVTPPPPGAGAAGDLCIGLNLTKLIDQGMAALLQSVDKVWAPSAPAGSDAWAQGHLAKTLVAATATALRPSAGVVAEDALFTMPLDQCDARLLLVSQQEHVPPPYKAALDVLQSCGRLIQLLGSGPSGPTHVRLDPMAVLDAASRPEGACTSSCAASGAQHSAVSKAGGSSSAAAAGEGGGVQFSGAGSPPGNGFSSFAPLTQAPQPQQQPHTGQGMANTHPASSPFAAPPMPPHFAGMPSSAPAGSGAGPMSRPLTSMASGSSASSFPFPPSPLPSLPLPLAHLPHLAAAMAPQAAPAPPPPAGGNPSFLDLFHTQLQQALPQVATPATAPSPPAMHGAHPLHGAVSSPLPDGLPHDPWAPSAPAPGSPLAQHQHPGQQQQHLPPALHALGMALQQVHQLRQDAVQAAHQVWHPLEGASAQPQDHQLRYLQRTMALCMIHAACDGVASQLHDAEMPHFPSMEAHHKAIAAALAAAGELLSLQPRFFTAGSYGPFPHALEMLCHETSGAQPSTDEYISAHSMLLAHSDPVLSMDSEGTVILDMRHVFEHAHNKLHRAASSPVEQIGHHHSGVPASALPITGSSKAPPPGFASLGQHSPPGNSSTPIGRGSGEYGSGGGSAGSARGEAMPLSAPNTRQPSCAGSSNGTQCKAAGSEATTPASGKYVPPCRRNHQQAPDAKPAPSTFTYTAPRADGTPTWRSRASGEGASEPALGGWGRVQGSSRPVVAAGPPA